MEDLDIETMHDYLDYFIEHTDQPFFNTDYPKLKEKVHQNCLAIQSTIQEINRDNFFDHLALIHHLEAEILIIFEFSVLRESDILNYFTEDEILKTATQDWKTYLKERCGMTLANPTPHSLHFLVK